MKTYLFLAWFSLLTSSLTPPLEMKKIVSKGKNFNFLWRLLNSFVTAKIFVFFNYLNFLKLFGFEALAKSAQKKFMCKLSVNINFFYCTLSMHFTFFCSHSQCDKIFVVSYFILGETWKAGSVPAQCMPK